MNDCEATITVRVQPRASTNMVVDYQGDILRVRITQPPEHGKANEALVDLLSDKLKLPKSSITILRGHAYRDKVVNVRGLSLEEIHHFLSS